MERQKSEPESELVGLGRAGRMLGLTASQIAELGRAGKIQMVDKGKEKKNAVSVPSIEAYCEELRTDFGIGRRRRISTADVAILLDEEILPFPLADTIGREEALSMLYSSTSERIARALATGQIEALGLEINRFTDRDPFRVSRSSVIACLEGTSKSREPSEEG
jgi:hypothetical protein